MDFEEIIKTKKLKTINSECEKAVKKRWDNVSKPLDSMGVFEELTAKMGGICDTNYPKAQKSIILVFASDNGIVYEGVSQTDQTVTALCASDIADGKKSVNCLAKANSIIVRVIDVGVAHAMASKEVVNKNIRKGSRNFAKEKALTRDEVISAINIGIEEVKRCKDENIDIIGIGEMGIGNTTTSSAVCAALLRLDAKCVTRRGAGLSDEGLRRKINVIDRAIKKYDLYNKDALEILECVGGYDIAALTGCCIGGAIYGIPIVLDGVVSNVSALLAETLIKGVREHLIASHSSKEIAAKMVLERLGLRSVIDADMGLGEGCGAVMMISLIKSALNVLDYCLSFEEVQMDAYTHY